MFLLEEEVYGVIVVVVLNGRCGLVGRDLGRGVRGGGDGRQKRE